MEAPILLKLYHLTKFKERITRIRKSYNFIELFRLIGWFRFAERFGKICRNIIRKRSSKPKFQVFNNPLMSVKSNKNFNQIIFSPKEWGRWVESAVGTHLLNSSLTDRFNLYYWNESSNEVDFVLEKNGKLIGIEVKSRKDSTNNGITILSELYKPKHVFIVGTNDISIEDFLSSSPVKLFDI